jgi:transposase
VFPNELSYRAFVLLLNARGWKNAQIADCLNWAEQTVRQTIHRWQAKGLVGLWDATGRGGQQRWQQEDMVYLEQCLQQEQRTYNSRQLAQKLASERLVHSSPDRTRRVLKKGEGLETHKG